MKNWWVPGCTIGYEHTFINGLADFLASLEGGRPSSRHAHRPCGPSGCATRCWKAPSGQWANSLNKKIPVPTSLPKNELFCPRPAFLDDPYFVAGTAVPDWLSVATARSASAAGTSAAAIDDPDPRVAALAGGVLQHFARRRPFPRHPALCRNRPGPDGPGPRCAGGRGRGFSAPVSWAICWWKCCWTRPYRRGPDAIGGLHHQCPERSTPGWSRRPSTALRPRRSGWR